MARLSIDPSRTRLCRLREVTSYPVTLSYGLRRHLREPRREGVLDSHAGMPPGVTTPWGERAEALASSTHADGRAEPQTRAVAPTAIGEILIRLHVDPSFAESGSILERIFSNTDGDLCLFRFHIMNNTIDRHIKQTVIEITIKYIVIFDILDRKIDIAKESPDERSVNAIVKIVEFGEPSSIISNS